jgi:hypothetical protein
MITAMNAPLELFDPAEIIQNLAARLAANYIFPEIAAQICDRLLKRLEGGEYDDFHEGDFFAYALTLHMQEINHDEHLWVRWHDSPLPEDDGQLRLNPEWVERQRRQAAIDNFGIHKVERLPGNIGLLDISYFYRPEWAGETTAAAMRLVSQTSALIIDLRKCPGGYPAMIARFAGYFLGEKPVHLLSAYWRDDDTTQEFWTQPAETGSPYTHKPVYVLTGKDTFSGGEACAYVLQSRRRVEVVGVKTDGGAHTGVSYRVHPHFEAFIPVGRTYDPQVGADWEGRGITPDIPALQEQAFSAAYGMALRSVIAALGEPAEGPERSLLEEAQKALIRLE